MDNTVYFFSISKNNQVLPFYFGDALYPGLNKNSCRARRHEIYHYYLKNDIDEVSIKDTLVGVGTPNLNLENVISNLNRFEESVGIRKSKFEEFQNGGNLLIPNCTEYKIIGSYWWGIAPPIHSLYTFLIRLLIRIEYNTPGKVFDIGKDDLDFVTTNDKFEYINIKSYIFILMKNVKKIFPKNKKNNYVYSLDENSHSDIHNFGVEYLIYKDFNPSVKATKDKVKEFKAKFEEFIKQ